MNRLVTGLDKENFSVFEGIRPAGNQALSERGRSVSLGVILS